MFSHLLISPSCRLSTDAEQLSRLLVSLRRLSLGRVGSGDSWAGCLRIGTVHALADGLCHNQEHTVILSGALGHTVRTRGGTAGPQQRDPGE